SGVVVISMEMHDLEIGMRIFAQQAGINAHWLRKGEISEGDREGIAATLPRLRDLPVWFCDASFGSIAKIQAAVRALRARHDIKLVVIDYLQLVKAPRNITDRRLQVEYISASLKTLAVEQGVVVLCLSSLARPERHAGPKRPSLGDLRESGSLEHDA